LVAFALSELLLARFTFLQNYKDLTGLGQLRGNQMSVEFLYVKPNIEVKNLVTGGDLIVYDPEGRERSDPTDGAGGDGLNFWSPVIGLSANLNGITDKYVKLPNMTLGVLLALTENFNNLWRIRCFPPDQPHFISYGDYVNHLIINLGLGVEVLEKLVYAGGGVSIGVGGEGSLNALNTTLDPSNKAIPLQGGLTVTGNYAPTFGLLVTPFEQKLKLAYSFRYHNQVDVEPLTIVANVNLAKQLNIPLTGQIYTSYTPTMHTVGLSYDFENFMVACDVVLKKWSDYDYSDTEKAIYLNRDKYGMVGIVPSGPEFDDTIDIHVGGEYRLNDQTKIMAGYQYKPSPVPNQSGKITNYIDMDQNIYSVGGSYKLAKYPVELTGSLRYFTFDDLTVDKTGVKGVTWGEAIGSTDPSYLATQSSYEVSGDAFMVTVGAKIGF